MKIQNFLDPLLKMFVTGQVSLIHCKRIVVIFIINCDNNNSEKTFGPWVVYPKSSVDNLTLTNSKKIHTIKSINLLAYALEFTYLFSNSATTTRVGRC